MHALEAFRKQLAAGGVKKTARRAPAAGEKNLVTGDNDSNETVRRPGRRPHLQVIRSSYNPSKLKMFELVF